MNKGLYGYEEVALEDLRETFLTKTEREFLNKVKTDKEFRKNVLSVMDTLKKCSIDEMRSMLIEKINKIEHGEVKEEEIERIEYEIALILSVIPIDIEEADKYWNEKINNIVDVGNKRKVLIEIAAQHPLIDGKPGSEFEQRLKKGIELYNKETEKGNTVTIYIPGSIHSIKKDGKWVTDLVSLSEAGKNFLIENGIPNDDIKADDANEKYKENGVYNSADECYVSSEIARNEDCGRIISVVSPTQVYRKALLYTQFGYKPEIYGVETKQEYHNFIGEAFWSLYITYAKDHTWQDGYLKEKTRQERNINYQTNEEINQILSDGIIIPESVKIQKEKWQKKYNIAQKNMEEKKNNEKILINLDVADLDENVITSILDVIKNNKEKEAIIYSQSKEQIDFINNKLSLDDKQFIYYEGKENDQFIVNEFYKESNKFKEIFEISSSSDSMNSYMQYINKGVIPNIVSIPTEKEDYNLKISKMYKSLIYNENELVPNVEER